MKKRRRRNQGFMLGNWKYIAILLGILIVVLFIVRLFKPYTQETVGRVTLKKEEISSEEPEIDVDLLTVNPYSRVGEESEEIRGIVMHYTANPGASAKNNRDYFESLKDEKSRKASSHFVIGLNGEIVQCIPTWEIAYASNERNIDTVSIECCHPDETGRFTKETYQSMVQLTAWLCKKYNLTEENVIRHYDVTGKICPKYFVEDEAEWQQFKEYIKQALE